MEGGFNARFHALSGKLVTKYTHVHKIEMKDQLIKVKSF